MLGPGWDHPGVFGSGPARFGPAPGQHPKALACERMLLFREGEVVVRSLLHFSDIRLLMSTPAFSIPVAIRDRISALMQRCVWTPEDFADLGPRTAVDRQLSNRYRELHERCFEL